ncbi:hypothetical protein [Exiguobacterium flavidum]|uniref:hypothetical protein n=1 Tax=Exiguobacterium flavidum TaxID=2184695 RepID=UPI000DF732D0|nr:hypothetical protein [Exiguobacterium flavidum]
MHNLAKAFIGSFFLAAGMTFAVQNAHDVIDRSVTRIVMEPMSGYDERTPEADGSTLAEQEKIDRLVELLNAGKVRQGNVELAYPPDASMMLIYEAGLKEELFVHGETIVFADRTAWVQLSPEDEVEFTRLIKEGVR